MKKEKRLGSEEGKKVRKSREKKGKEVERKKD